MDTTPHDADFAIALDNYGIPYSEVHISYRTNGQATTTRITHLPTRLYGEHTDEQIDRRAALTNLHHQLRSAA